MAEGGGGGGGEGRGSLWTFSKVESSTRARVLLSKVYPAGKLQWHFACAILRGLLIVPMGTVGPLWPGDSFFQAVGAGLWALSNVESLMRAHVSTSKVYLVGGLQWRFAYGVLLVQS